jgi:hypothetical protein
MRFVVFPAQSEFPNILPILPKVPPKDVQNTIKLLKSLMKLPNPFLVCLVCKTIKPCHVCSSKRWKKAKILQLSHQLPVKNTQLPTTSTPPNASEQSAMPKPNQQRKTSIPNTHSPSTLPSSPSNERFLPVAYVKRG